MPPILRQKLIKGLSISPYRLPGRLATFFTNHSDLGTRFLEFNPIYLKSSSEDSFRRFARDVEAALAIERDPALNRIWDELSSSVEGVFRFGYSGPVETIAAMMLAGATISKKIPADGLRNLHPSLMNAVNVFNPADPHPYAKAYLRLGLEATSPVNQKINSILRADNSAIKLKLGKELQDLSLDKIEELRIKYFGKEQKFLEYGRPTGLLLSNNVTQWRPDIILKAPDIVKLNLKSLTCEQQQDPTGDDEVFVLTCFSQIQNLQDVYNQIDNAIKAGIWDIANLNIIPSTTIKVTPITAFSSGITKDFNFEAGSVDMTQGFGPYHGNLTCYEDDDQEYDAVVEVLDKISDYAGYVQEGANFVAAVSGPTLVAAGAAAVSTLATGVQVCSEVASAVVKIVNMLDENDYLGFRKYDSISDYVKIEPGTLNFPTADIGNYLMNCQEIRVGQENVTRNWQFHYTKGNDNWINSDSGAIAGIKEDYNVSFNMNEYTDKLIHWGVDHICINEGYRGDKGHAEWRFGPTLDASNHQRVVGQIHVGLAGFGEVRDSAWAQGIRIHEDTL